MRFAVLGTLQVRTAEGANVRLGGPVRRQLLAALLCRAGRIVPADSLIEDVWGELAPRSAAKTLQSHIVRLRDDLGRGGEPVLRTEPAGYLLTAQDVDAARFEHLAHDLPADPRRAIEQLAEALGLWRGEAYLDFGEAAFAVGERLRLTELRSAARDLRTDLTLGIGQGAALIPDLEARVTAEPYRERSWEQLMLALYRSGRQADALGAFRRVRDLLAADLGVDPGPDLRKLETQILRQDDGLLAGLPERIDVGDLAAYAGRCPYRGLAGYGEDDSGLFVGRERLTAELAGRLADHRLVVVTGPSGSGKSSLLRAGVLPALRGGAIPGSATWRTTVCLPSQLSDSSAATADLVVVDQAEELFTVLTDVTRSAAADVLLARIAAGARIVLVLRGDFFGRLAGIDRLAGLVGSTVLVRPMRDDEVRRAVVEPAARCGCSIEAAMLEEVLDEVSGRPGALPLLSVALVRAWRNRSDDDRLTLAGYRQGGAMAGALEAGAEEVWAALTDVDRAAARRLLTRLTAVEGGDWARRPLASSEVPTGAEAAALDQLTKRRLIVINGSRIELVHEALLSSWPRLRGWLEERALGAELLEHLSAAARAWAAADRPGSDLYRGARLHAAGEWAGEHPDDIAEVDAEFLAASAAGAQSELTAARERADREAAGRRRLRYAVAALAAVLVATLVAVVVAVGSQREAHRSTERADAAALTADARRLAAESLSAPDLRTALLLAVAGYRLQPSTDTRSALLTTIEKNGSALWRISTAQRVQWLGASADGSQVWISDNLAEITRYDTRTRRVLSHFPVGAGRVHAVSPDGRLLVASGAPPQSHGRGIQPGTVRVVDARTGRVVRVLGVSTPDGPAAWHTAAFTGDGRWLVVLEATDASGAHSAPAVAVYDAHDLAGAPRVVRLDSAAAGLATGRSAFVVTTTRRAVEVIDAADLHIEHRGVRSELPDTVGPSVGGGDIVALAPDASVFAAVDASGHVTAERTNRLGGAPLSLQLGAGEWQALGFSPSGDELAAGGGTGAVAAVSLANGRPVQDLPGDSGSVLGLSWGGSAARPGLYTAGLDSQIVSWDLSTGPRMLRLSGPARPTGEYGVVGGRVVGFYPIQPGDGGTAPLDKARLLVTDLATARTRTWSLGLRGADYLANDSRDAQARWALLTVSDSATQDRCELRSLTTGRVVHTFAMHHPATAAGYCVLSRDGSIAVVASGQHRLSTYRMPSFTRIGSIDVVPRSPVAKRIIDIPLGYTPSGRLVVWAADPGTPGSSGAAGTQLLDLVDARDGRVLGQASLGVGGQPETLNYSPDGSRLLVGTNSGQVAMYSALDLAPIATGVLAADGFVFAATFSPDGATVVTTGSDGTMRFFDGTALQPIGTPIAMPGEDWTFGGFDGNGGQVAGLAAVGSGRERYFSFPGDAARWAAVACGIADSELTTAEWARYVGDRPYTKVCG